MRTCATHAIVWCDPPRHAVSRAAYALRRRVPTTPRLVHVQCVSGGRTTPQEQRSEALSACARRRNGVRTLCRVRARSPIVCVTILNRKRPSPRPRVVALHRLCDRPQLRLHRLALGLLVAHRAWCHTRRGAWPPWITHRRRARLLSRRCPRPVLLGVRELGEVLEGATRWM